MLARASDLRKAIAFYAIAVVLCGGVTLAASVFGDRAPLVAMLTPFAAVLLMLLVLTRDGYTADGWRALGITRAGLSAWPLAVSVPLLVLGFSFGCVWMSGVAEFAWPAHAASMPSFVLALIVSIVLVTVTVALAEEIGWRGYLLPHLMEIGSRRAVLVCGLLHGVWHLPVLLGTELYHPAGARLVVVPSFLVAMTLAGVCYGSLRLTTASVWPAAIAHACFNVFWDAFNQCTHARSPEMLEYLAGESGVLTVSALAVAAVWFDRRAGALRDSPSSNEAVSSTEARYSR